MKKKDPESSISVEFPFVENDDSDLMSFLTVLSDRTGNEVKNFYRCRVSL